MTQAVAINGTSPVQEAAAGGCASCRACTCEEACAACVHLRPWEAGLHRLEGGAAELLCRCSTRGHCAGCSTCTCDGPAFDPEELKLRLTSLPTMRLERVRRYATLPKGAGARNIVVAGDGRVVLSTHERGAPPTTMTVVPAGATSSAGAWQEAAELDIWLTAKGFRPLPVGSDWSAAHPLKDLEVRSHLPLEYLMLLEHTQALADGDAGTTLSELHEHWSSILNSNALGEDERSSGRCQPVPSLVRGQALLLSTGHCAACAPEAVADLLVDDLVAVSLDVGPCIADLDEPFGQRLTNAFDDRLMPLAVAHQLPVWPLAAASLALTHLTWAVSRSTDADAVVPPRALRRVVEVAARVLLVPAGWHPGDEPNLPALMSTLLTASFGSVLEGVVECLNDEMHRRDGGESARQQLERGLLGGAWLLRELAVNDAALEAVEAFVLDGNRWLRPRQQAALRLVRDSAAVDVLWSAQRLGELRAETAGSHERMARALADSGFAALSNDAVLGLFTKYPHVPPGLFAAESSCEDAQPNDVPSSEESGPNLEPRLEPEASDASEPSAQQEEVLVTRLVGHALRSTCAADEVALTDRVGIVRERTNELRSRVAAARSAAADAGVASERAEAINVTGGRLLRLLTGEPP